MASGITGNWESNIGAGHVRLVWSTEYDRGSNSSLMSVYLQAYNSTYVRVMNLIKNGEYNYFRVRCNGGAWNTLVAAWGDLSHYMASPGDGKTWINIRTSAGNPAVWRFTVPHTADGTATVEFAFAGSLYSQTGPVNTPFNGRSATVRLAEQRGGAQLDTGSAFTQALCHIDTGSAFALALPYIDTGTGWKLCT